MVQLVRTAEMENNWIELRYKSEKRNSETGNSVDSEWREKRVKYHCRKLTNQIPTKDQT